MGKRFFFVFLIWAGFVHNIAFAQNKNLNSSVKDSAFPFFPAMSLENPINSGQLGVIVIGGTVENKTRIANQPDANAGIYIGLGEPEKLIGAGATVNIYGLSNKEGQKDNLGEGSLGLHLNKFFLHNRLLLEGGVENLFLWRAYPDDWQYITYQRSFYFSGNYLFYIKPKSLQKPFSYVSITAGVGNGFFRSDKNYTAGRSGSFDPFFSLATPVIKGTNIIAEWNGYDVGLGVSSIPFQKIPFEFSLAVTDLVFGNPRIVSSVSFPFNFIKRNKPRTGLPLRPIGIRPVRSERTM